MMPFLSWAKRLAKCIRSIAIVALNKSPSRSCPALSNSKPKSLSQESAPPSNFLRIENVETPLVYEPSSAGQLRQGEVLSNVCQPVTEMVEVEGKIIARTTPLIHRFAVILSQDCDLEWDFASRNSGDPESNPKNLPNVLFCELSEAAALRNQAGLKSNQWSKVKQNNDPRFQFLEGCPTELDADKSGFRDLAIDFKRYFTLPTTFVYSELQTTAKRRLRWTPLVGQPTGLIKIVLQAARGTLPRSRGPRQLGQFLMY